MRNKRHGEKMLHSQRGKQDYWETEQSQKKDFMKGLKLLLEYRRMDNTLRGVKVFFYGCHEVQWGQDFW